MNIVVLDAYTLNPGDLSWEPLRALGPVTTYERTAPELINQRLANAQLVFTNKTQLTKETLEANPQIRFIGVLATGYNVVDVPAAKALGITICNVPAYGTDAVAQYVFALLLGICHRVESHHQTVIDGVWQKSLDFCYWQSGLVELAGKTLGLVGFGRIAQRTAQIAQAFGMNVVAYHHRAIPGTLVTAVDQVNFVSVIEMVTLDALYETSDVISLHVPLVLENPDSLTPTLDAKPEAPGATKHMIDATAIAKMKDGVIIINTARGLLIHESALASALVTGKVRAAAVDVVSQEPILETNPLLSAPNIIITPHIAWAPIEARQRLLNTAVENLRAYLSGKPINTI